MKYTIMQCDCCGETFLFEHGESGYIEHTNLSNNWAIIVKREIQDITDAICKDGNALRNEYDINSRLNCFESYCIKNELTDLMPKVREKVLSFIDRLKELDMLHDEIKDLLESHNCTTWEHEYIGMKYQAFDYFRARRNK